ncbi:MAG: hypothetical protein ABFE07_25965 [Armatimonadia bacterium]
MTHLQRAAVVALVLAALAAVSPCFGQPEMYALSHPFALPTATTTRLFGMGGFVTCIPDRGFANPAFAGALTDTSVVARQSLTSFESGLRFKGQQASLAFPLKDDKRGMQIVGFRLTSHPSSIPMPTPVPSALAISMSEYELSLHYGQRVSHDLLLGVGVGPVFHNSFNLSVVPSGHELAQITSESDKGMRLGAVYECGSRARLGFVYDCYDEDVVASGHAIGGDGLPFSFTSKELAFGLSYQLTDQLLGAIEWQQLSTEQDASDLGPGMKFGDAGWRIGFEGVSETKWAYRVGSNDGAISLGLGYLGDDDWTFNYAFIRDWNKDLIGELMGPSNTHQFELSYKW